ncbi:AP-3 complex subunit beta-2 [Cyphellophora attinorum]|uniref:AP-3 complex subunit beta-2 n=1 Tax=Cyphellophora attinorum TaxID=1664694 RepID=A0A0N1H321_9EURO|nr:AP-3 complex subunit beta-2 [Phialophora attinorum]KPI35092.1 AP-3 complex subunit beta-2 [Phialophora attinorum]
MDSVARVSSALDPARDLTAEAAQAVGVGRAVRTGGPSKGLSHAKLKALLDSRSDREILDGLRRVVAMIYQNKPCLPFFSSVVKNVANPNIEVKKLVYIYLLHYAESDPDLALLSVNAIQKSLTDTNPQVRALALRTMSGMRVPVISQIVSLAIKRGISDMSPHVRKAAALAIPKCYNLEPNSLPQLLDYLSILLGDKQYFVAGPAVQAFLEICPDRTDLIHKHYRGLVRKLVDMDEWSQLATLKVLAKYSRQCFPYTTKKVTRTTRKGFYEDEPDEVEDTDDTVRVLQPDLEALLKAAQNLLQSRSAAVITSVVATYLYVGTAEYLESAIGPLLSVLRSSQETEEIVLQNMVAVALEHPALFVPWLSHFLLASGDTPSIWTLKLEMLTLIFPHGSASIQALILNELEHFAHSASVDKVQESVRAIGRCAQTSPSASSKCFQVLLQQISHFDNLLVSEVLTVMRHLIQRDAASHHKTIVRLARNLDKTSSPQARATIIWLVGEFAVLEGQTNTGGVGASIAPDVLRILVKGFSEEVEEVKMQIVLLAAKCYLLWLQQNISKDSDDADPPLEITGHAIPKLWDYVLVLSRYDTSYDLRDRARLFKNLLSEPREVQLASLLLLAPKPVPHVPSPSANRKGLLIGSTSLLFGRDEIVLHGLPGYEDLPPWVETGNEPDPELRENDVGLGGAGDQKAAATASSRLEEAIREQGLAQSAAVGPSKPGSALKNKDKAQTLDDWLAESEDEESSGSGEEETGSEEDDGGEDESGDEFEDSDEDSDDDHESEQRKGLMT